MSIERWAASKLPGTPGSVPTTAGRRAGTVCRRGHELDRRRMDETAATARTGRPTIETRAWEARVLGDLSVILMRYLTEHPCPCPGESAIDRDLRQWAAGFERAGQAHRAALGVARLRLIPQAAADPPAASGR